MLNWRAVLLLYRKEVLHYIRDRRTILSLIIGPILVNSLLLTGVNYFLAKGRKSAEEKPLTVAVRHLNALPGLREALTEAKLKLRESDDPRGDAAEKRADAGIDVVSADGRVKTTLYGDLTGIEGMVLRTRLTQPLQKLRSEKLRMALAELGATEAVLTPFAQEVVDVTPPAKSSAFLLGNVLPLLLLQFLFMGSLYPAIDMTAGEKERRTIEMTLSAPVAREELVLGKLLAVMSSGLFAMVMTLASMAFTVRSFRTGPAGRNPLAMMQGISLEPSTLLLMALAVLPMAMLLASVVLALGAAAKSMQEATSYITPLMLVTAVLSMVSFLPGFTLDAGTALLPVSNFALTIKGVLTGDWKPVHLALALSANLIYALGAVWLAVLAFRRESILFRA